MRVTVSEGTEGTSQPWRPASLSLTCKVGTFDFELTKLCGSSGHRRGLDSGNRLESQATSLLL